MGEVSARRVQVMAAKHLVSELRLHVSVSLVCTYLGTPSYLGCLLQSIRIQAEREHAGVRGGWNGGVFDR